MEKPQSVPLLALRLFTPFSGGTGPPGPGATAQAGGSQRALGDSRVLSFRRPAVMNTVTGFSLQRGEKLRQESRYPDRHPQGGPLISEMARKYAQEDR